ncbi:MAG: leucine-rich repeat domain-containing protein [Oscillospiraceae bacterium]|nr:leucine-rich repeat domain-containing protein [Oscillospiraceae bacterium]
MWICPKCSRENGNSFNVCKGCGYMISSDEKEYAIENTKRQLHSFNEHRAAPKNTYRHTRYSGPQVVYDDDDSYTDDYYSDDMFDDDDYVKKSKKIIIIPIVIVLLLAIAAGVIYYMQSKGYINIFSSSEYNYTEDSRGIMITGYRGKDTTLEIPDIIDGYVVYGIADKAFAESNLKSVKLPNTIKYIGERAFFDSENLHFVSMEEGVEEIGAYAFASCSVITDTFIPESVQTIGENIFRDSGNVYIQGVPGSTAMKYALERDISFTPTNEKQETLKVTPVRINDRQTTTTSKTGYGASHIFSFMPYEDAKYQISVEASIEGYLKINEFGTMGKVENNNIDKGINHQTTITVELKKEKKYYFAIENQGTEVNKNIEYALELEIVTDEQTKSEQEAKSWIGKTYSFIAYTDLFYDRHIESGTTHFLEWNTNNQEIIDYYVQEDGTIWLAINAPQSEELTDEYGNIIESSGIWWHKIQD